ncbi:ABC-type nitrate/sulfonate/bicarbonate transport system permease component [Pseudacidovorax sp. 1753]
MLMVIAGFMLGVVCGTVLVGFMVGRSRYAEEDAVRYPTY